MSSTRATDRLGRGQPRRRVPRQVDRRRRLPLDPHVGDVLREVDQHRPGASGRRDVERLGDDLGDLGDVLHEVVVLRHPHGDAGRVDLLEGVRADRAGGDLAGDDDERDGVHVGVGEWRDDVRRARAARDDGDARPAGRVGVTLGRVSGALLVADVNVPDRRIEDRVVDGKDGAPREAEGDLDALCLEALDQGLCSSHFHCCLHSPGIGCASPAADRCPACRTPRTKRPPFREVGCARTARTAARYSRTTTVDRICGVLGIGKSLSERPGNGKPPSGDELRVP